MLQLIEDRFSTLLEHSKKLLIKRWIFGIADGFITKELPHNVTWGLSILYAMENHRDGTSVSAQGMCLAFLTQTFNYLVLLNCAFQSLTCSFVDIQESWLMHCDF